MADAIVRGHRKRADLVGREVSGNGRAAGRIGMALIAVKNRGTGQPGSDLTQINPYKKRIHVRTGALPVAAYF